MKKLFFAALLAVSVAGSAFASDVTKLSTKVKNAFDAQFAGAQNVEWSSRETFTKAAFNLGEERIEAFFSVDGELIATSRKIDFKRLPLNAIQKIKKDYASSSIEEVIEFDQDGEKNYYVSLDNGQTKKILEVSLYGAVSVYHGVKK